MGIKYKLKLKDLKFEYLKEYFIPFLKYFKKTKKIENYSDLKEFIQKKLILKPQIPVFIFFFAIIPSTPSKILPKRNTNKAIVFKSFKIR